MHTQEKMQAGISAWLIIELNIYVYIMNIYYIHIHVEYAGIPGANNTYNKC